MFFKYCWFLKYCLFIAIKFINFIIVFVIILTFLFIVITFIRYRLEKESSEGVVDN